MATSTRRPQYGGDGPRLLRKLERAFHDDADLSSRLVRLVSSGDARPVAWGPYRRRPTPAPLALDPWASDTLECLASTEKAGARVLPFTSRPVVCGGCHGRAGLAAGTPWF